MGLTAIPCLIAGPFPIIAGAHRLHMQAAPASSFEEDFLWQTRFHDHFCEIARLACEVEIAPPKDDQNKNTDYILTPRKDPPICFSARARRYEHREPRVSTFSIRLGRPSGAKTEMKKLLEGRGDLLVYGYEAYPNWRRLHSWLLGDLDVLRQYICDGGSYEIGPPNDDGTTAAYFHRYQLPPEFVMEESVMNDQMILEVMTTSPEPALCIARRAGLPPKPVWDALLRLAGMEDVYSEPLPWAKVVFHEGHLLALACFHCATSVIATASMTFRSTLIQRSSRLQRYTADPRSFERQQALWQGRWWELSSRYRPWSMSPARNAAHRYAITRR